MALQSPRPTLTMAGLCMCEGDMREIINARHTHGVGNEIRIQSIKPGAGLRRVWDGEKFGRRCERRVASLLTPAAGHRFSSAWERWSI